MKKGMWLWAAAGIAVLLLCSSALGGSVASGKRFQRTFLCVNKHDGLIKVISRRQQNRCAVGWKRYRVSDLFGKGMRGTRGIPGAPGPQGPQGQQGPGGSVGTAGAIGARGATGANGATGEAGPAGAMGPIGPQGPMGLQGPTGAAGTDGANGVDGAIGPQGQIGQQGPIGLRGPAGANGADGATGAQGPAGQQGTSGAKGDRGATGAAGPQGIQGPAGPAGLDGNAIVQVSAAGVPGQKTTSIACPGSLFALSGGFQAQGSVTESYRWFAGDDLGHTAAQAGHGWTVTQSSGNSGSLTAFAYCA
jgi:hypothetical protein